jgi:hypothetical protein
MLRKYMTLWFLLAQIALFALAAGNARAIDPDPPPQCYPCAR